MRIGAVGLAEAGNLGDDLILLSLLSAVTQWEVSHTFRYVSFGEHLDWDSLVPRLGLNLDLQRTSGRVQELPGSRHCQGQFADCDVVVVGGGGLFQDTHSPDTPFRWLNYLPEPDLGIPAIGLGLGLGPLSARSVSFLRGLGDPFVHLLVRDWQSMEVAASLGWNASLSGDLVSSQLLSKLLGSELHRRRSSTDSLAVALRAWPGLAVHETAEHICNVARVEEVSEVQFFVLEAHGEGSPDVEFTREVARRVGLPSEVHIYRPEYLVDFLDLMTSSQTAVSMKFHSSLLWGLLGAKTYPISYAPKTASLFGLPKDGLVISDEPVAPRVRIAEPDAIRAAVFGLRDSRGLRDINFRIKRGTRVGRQAVGLLHSSRATLRRRFLAVAKRPGRPDAH